MTRFGRLAVCILCLFAAVMFWGLYDLSLGCLLGAAVAIIYPKAT